MNCNTYDPWYTTTLRSVQDSNSLCQLGIVERGAITRNGPLMPYLSTEYTKVRDWIVLPKPISSARIQFRLKKDKKNTCWNKILSLAIRGRYCSHGWNLTYPLYHEKRSQFNPSSWYSRSVLPPLKTGEASSFFQSSALGRFLLCRLKIIFYQICFVKNVRGKNYKKI